MNLRQDRGVFNTRVMESDFSREGGVFFIWERVIRVRVCMTSGLYPEVSCELR